MNWIDLTGLCVGCASVVVCVRMVVCAKTSDQSGELERLKGELVELFDSERERLGREITLAAQARALTPAKRRKVSLTGSRNN